MEKRQQEKKKIGRQEWRQGVKSEGERREEKIK